MPAITWIKTSVYKNSKTGASEQVIGVEDQQQAAAYEQALKRRPVPFVAQIRSIQGATEVQIGINVATLAHRAVSRLPTLDRTRPVEVSWRLIVDKAVEVTSARVSSRKFIIPDNKTDELAPMPPKWREDVPLRPEQSRSLTWMIAQESPNLSFSEQEVAEAALGPLSWRVEVKAERKVDVRGGVLADEVGFGKTAITLGLICSQLQAKIPKMAIRDQVDGYILTDATLVFVPSHLIRQWKNEATNKFCQDLDVKMIGSLAELNKLSIQDIVNADIVIVSQTLLKSADCAFRIFDDI